MVKRLVILLVLLPLAAAADSDTSLTCAQYGFRVLNILNVKDTLHGTSPLDSGFIQACVRMAFGEIAKSLAVPKVKLIPVTASTRGYLVERGLIWVKWVTKNRNRSTRPLVEISPDTARGSPEYEDKINNADSLRFYFIHGDSIYPLPVLPYGDTIQVFYYARPTQPTATDAVDIPYEYRDAMIFLAAFHAANKIQMPQAQKFWELYTTELSEIAQQQADRKNTWRGVKQ